jgi:hypothetical protein
MIGNDYLNEKVMGGEGVKQPQNEWSWILSKEGDLSMALIFEAHKSQKSKKAYNTCYSTS